MLKSNAFCIALAGGLTGVFLGLGAIQAQPRKPAAPLEAAVGEAPAAPALVPAAAVQRRTDAHTINVTMEAGPAAFKPAPADDEAIPTS